MSFIGRLFKKEIKQKTIFHDYMKNSFSQSGEDLIVEYLFNGLGISKPTYIDIGAHHPFYMNNTFLFYLKGANGINIEPDPHLFNSFISNRDKDVNLNIGISDIESESDFYIISTPTLNTFSLETAKSYEKEGDFKIIDTKKIKTSPVNTVIKDYFNNVFPDFLSLDAEGVDEMIIKSIDFENSYPKIICVETISFSNTGNGIKNQSLIDYIVDKGYLLYADTNINSIFVRKELWVK